MKKRLFLVISAMLVFGLAIVVYSSVTATNLAATAASCCCHGDSCPTKAKSADGKEAASCCDNCECCNGDAASCPMKNMDAASASAVKADHAKSCPMKVKDATAATATKIDDAKSCPMMKKDADGNPIKMDAAHGSHVKHEMKADGSGCCCACCQKTTDKEKTAAPAV